MERRLLDQKIDEILMDNNLGVLSVRTAEEATQRTQLFWLSFVSLRDEGQTLFALTPRNAKKLRLIGNRAHVEVILQKKNYEEVANLVGVVTVLDIPTLKSKVFEVMGSRIENPWKFNLHEDYLVLAIHYDHVFLRK